MLHGTTDSSGQMHCHTKCISWTAIIIGALVGIGLGFLLNVFGLAIGLSAFNPGKEGMATLAIGGFAGIVITTIVSMFVAGWVSGYLGRPYSICREVGVLYGFSTWCLILLVTAIWTAHMNDFVAMTYHSLSQPNTNVKIVLNEVKERANAERANAARTPAERPVKASEAKTPVSETAQVISGTKIVNAAGTSLFLIFALFFLGALASCFGGYCGLKPREM